MNSATTTHLSRRTRLRGEDGQSLVEFALLLPILLLLILGMLEFGKAFNYWNDANQIAGEGARFAAVNRNPGSTTNQTLQQWLKAQGTTAELRGEVAAGVRSTPGAKVCIEYPNGSKTVGSPVKVTVSADYNWLPFVKERGGLSDVTIEGSATMRIEVPQTLPAGCS